MGVPCEQDFSGLARCFEDLEDTPAATYHRQVTMDLQIVSLSLLGSLQYDVVTVAFSGSHCLNSSTALG